MSDRNGTLDDEPRRGTEPAARCAAEHGGQGASRPDLNHFTRSGHPALLRRVSDEGGDERLVTVEGNLRLHRLIELAVLENEEREQATVHRAILG